MKRLAKSIFVFIFILSIMIQTPSAGAVSSRKYCDNIPLMLKTLDLLDESFEIRDGNITRAEFAKMVYALSGEFYSENTEHIFKDVAAGRDGEMQIYSLYERGILKGNGEGYFYPDRYITLIEAVKICASLIGYSELEASMGGYPQAYITAAAKSGLTDFVGCGFNDYLDYKGALILYYNTITAHYPKAKSFGADVKYVMENETTVLNDFFDIYVKDGVVFSDGFTSLTGNNVCSDGAILIDGERFLCNEGVPQQILGRYVDVYYKKDTTDNKLLYLEVNNSKNTIKTIEAKDMCYDDSEFSSECIVFEDERGNKKKIRVDENADYILNNKAYTEMRESGLKRESGYFILIDNNSDGKVDVVEIKSYDIYVVSGINYDKGEVYDYFGNTLSIDFENSKTKYRIYSTDGQEMQFDKIGKGCIVSAAVSSDKEYAELIVSREYLSGSVDAKDDENGKISINNTWYLVSKNLKTDIAAEKGVIDKSSLNIGKKGRFYLSFDRKISYVTNENNGLEYGYLLAGGTQGGLTKTVEIKIFTQQGEVAIYSCNEKVKTNSGRIGCEKLLDNTNFVKDGKFIQQLVKFSLNENGKINELYYAQNVTDNYEDAVFYNTGGTMAHRSAANSFDDYAASQATLFVLEKREQDGSIDEEGIYIGTASSLPDGDQYDVIMYDYGYCRVPRAIVLENSGDKINYTNQLLIITSVKQAKYDDDDYKTLVEGYRNGNKVSYYLDDNVKVTSKYPDVDGTTLKEGDAILPYMNNKGIVVEYAFILRAQDDTPSEFQQFIKGSNLGGELAVTYAEVYDVEDFAMGIWYNGSITGIPLTSSSKWYIYNSSEPKGERVSIAQPQAVKTRRLTGKGSKVLVVTRRNHGVGIVIVD